MPERFAEPWQLASYTASLGAHAFLAAARPVASSTPLASTSKQKIEDQDVAIITVQGDGVHLLEVSEQSPLESHTLGPSVRFTTAAVSCTTIRAIEENGGRATKRQRRTYVGVDGEDGSGEVWCWTSPIRKDGTPVGEAPKAMYKISSPILAVEAARDSDNACVVVSNKLICLNEVLQAAASLDLPPLSGTVHSARLAIWRAEDCTFLPDGQRTELYTVACVTRFHSMAAANSTKMAKKKRKSDAASASILSASIDFVLISYDIDGSRLTAFANLNLPIPGLVDVGCNPSGIVSCLTTDFHLISYNVAGSPPTLILLTSLALARITPFIAPTATQSTALLALNDSFIFIAAKQPKDASTLILLLWDIRFGALVAEQAFGLPSELTDGAVDLSLSLASLSANSISLTLSAPGKRSLVFVLPAEVPSSSTLATVVGTHAATEHYIAATSADTPSTALTPLRNPLTSERKAAHVAASHEGRQQALFSIVAALREKQDGEEAERAYEAWYVEECDRIQTYREEKRAAGKAETPKRPAVAHGVGAHKYTRQQRVTQRKARKHSRRQDLPELPADFVTTLLAAIFASQDATPSTLLVYPASLFHQLLHRDVVFNYMVAGGLLPALLKCNDWEGITLAMRLVPDLPELDLAQLLRFVVDAAVPEEQVTLNGHGHDEDEVAKSEDEEVEDAMLVDTSKGKGVPSLPRFLARFIRYPTSTVPLRTALRSHLTLASLPPILDVFELWLDHWAGGEKRWAYYEPPLGPTICYIQAVLDTFFVGLLTDTALHDRLENLYIAVQRLVVVSVNLQTLVGPLQAFVRASKVVRREREARQDQGPVEPDAKKRAKRAAAIADSLAVGEYTVEEFDL